MATTRLETVKNRYGLEEGWYNANAWPQSGWVHGHVRRQVVGRYRAGHFDELSAELCNAEEA